MTRRRFIGAGVLAAIGAAIALPFRYFNSSRAAITATSKPGDGDTMSVLQTPAEHPAEFLHQTDLFRPHNDPDDHWDLACVFAIAKLRRATLRGILIDYPPGAPILNHKSDPDLGSVAQLSYLSKLYPPVAIGRPEPFGTRGDLPNRETPGGVQFLLDALRNSAAGLFIPVVGSARDLAEAIAREPDLFARKCRGIYLNAGMGEPDPSKITNGEWNVALDPSAYAKIFDAPCPIYWMPCLQDEDRVPGNRPRPNASHYKFRQKDILNDLSKPLRNYFGWMLAKENSSEWLEALGRDMEPLLREKGEDLREMYCTACFFDIADLGVTADGEVISKDPGHADNVFRFEPIDVTCTVDGKTTWTPAKGSTNRFIFHVLNTDRYTAAMTKAMRSLLVAADF